tara:strand:- start:299 stop:520 length:222 start_codon:yes stop_codon:yes gene_type:complete
MCPWAIISFWEIIGTILAIAAYLNREVEWVSYLLKTLLAEQTEYFSLLLADLCSPSGHGEGIVFLRVLSEKIC